MIRFSLKKKENLPHSLKDTYTNSQQSSGLLIKNAYDRLRKATQISKPMKHLRKTSASLISGNAHYRGLEELFLGHSPKSMSDRHYSQPPEQLLAEATEWLRGEYGVG